MTEQVPEWEEEGKKFSKAWIIGLVIGILVIGCFVVLFVFPGGGENQPPVAPRPPVASFSFSPSAPTTEDTVQFTDTSSDEDGYLVSWSWSFGDGTTSTLQNPSRQFTTSGTYTVTLTVTDDDGKTNYRIREVVVLPSAQNEVSFQNFELGNGTPGSYCYSAWRSSVDTESSIVHGGARSVKMIVPAFDGENIGAVIGINAASSSGYMDFQNAIILKAWVYDTQGSNTIELKLKDSNGTIGPGLWSDMSSTQNQWVQISLDISTYSGVNKSRIASIEFYEWNQGTYYFDDVSFVQSL